MDALQMMADRVLSYAIWGCVVSRFAQSEAHQPSEESGAHAMVG